MAKKKGNAETAKETTSTKQRSRTPRLPKNAVFVVSRGSDNGRDTLLFRMSEDITPEELETLMAVMQAYIDANTPEPQVEHYGFGPPPS